LVAVESNKFVAAAFADVFLVIQVFEGMNGNLVFLIAY